MATRAKHNFDDVRAHLATLTMTPLHVSGNAHDKLVTLATQERTGPVPMKRAQDDMPSHPELTNHDNSTMPMDGPGKVRAHPVNLTKPPPSLQENDLVELTTFMNALTPTMKLTRDIISSTVCPGVPGRKPRHASGNVHASLATLVRRAMALIQIRSNVDVPS